MLTRRSRFHTSLLSLSFSACLIGFGQAVLPLAASACAMSHSTTAPLAAANGTVEYKEFPSASLDRPVRYAVSLPASYAKEPARRYPVVIFLHGLNNSERDWEGRGLEERLEALRASGKVGEFIVALPFGANSFYLNAKNGTRYEDAIVKDFIPYIDKTYRTIGTPESRVIEGISMGGFGALVIAFKHPEMFSAVVAHSAAVFEELPKPPQSEGDRRSYYRYRIATEIFGAPPDAEFFRENNPLSLAELRAAEIRSLAIYFDVGAQDRYGFLEGNRKLHRVLTEAKVPHEFHEAPGDHGWAFLYDRTEEAMTFVWRVLSTR